MNLYKKNPEIKESFWLQGQQIDDASVLLGEKWEMFANPNTFPGTPPKLVRIDFNDLDKDQKLKVKNTPEVVEPPRHAGVIKSSSIIKDANGGIEVPSRSNIEDTKPKSIPEVRDVKKEHRIEDLYEVSFFIKDFPGITEKNVARVIKAYPTIESLAAAKNADLAQIGVRVQYFNKVREAAVDVLKGLKD